MRKESPLRRHPRRDEIDEALGTFRLATEIASEFDVHADDVREHRRLHPFKLAEADCAVCQHAERARIDVAIYGLSADVGDHRDVATRFGIDDGQHRLGDLVLRHVRAGHMRERSFYEGKTPAQIEAGLADEAS